MINIWKELNDPSPEYRPIPFWSWNDKLDPDLIRAQIREMKKAGMGGFFMHARGGLETEYLSNDWMEAIEAGLDEAGKTGLNAWVYDEEGWPSGFVGGKVCALGDRYHGRWLETELRPLNSGDGVYFTNPVESPILGIYRLDLNAGTAGMLPPDSDPSALDGEYLVISHSSNPYYIDILNPEVTARFIEFTHEAYLERFPKSFQGDFKGFFTDEPRLSGRNIDEDFPWSYILPEEYRTRYNELLVQVLPSLFYPVGDYRQIRYNFWNLVNHLFAEGFMKQIGDWCRNHNCRLTGHIMMEETLSTQMPNTGGVMPFYEFMDIPGMDWLRRTMSSPVVPKQVSSAAAQTGKKQILTESFALCGWNAGFEDLKWVAQWQYVNGVNLLCQHLQGYTIRGLRKRDYPPSLFIQQPWWGRYHLFNDYFARLGVILSEGTQQVDVLVIHPMRSGWILFDGYQKDELWELDERFAELLETLSGLHIEYHLGDETLLAKYGKAENGILSVGECRYSHVLIPETLTLASKTFELLDAFSSGGGDVRSIGDRTILKEAKASAPGWLKNSDIKISIDDLKQGNCAYAGFISLKGADGQEAAQLHATLRDFPEGTFRYIINKDRSNPISVIALIPDTRPLYLYDPVANTYRALLARHEGEWNVLPLYFEASRSMVLLSSEAFALESTGTAAIKVEVIRPEGPWKLNTGERNVITLDRCRYSLDGSPWQNETDVIHLFWKLLKDKASCRLSMEFTADIRRLPEPGEKTELIIERAGEFGLTVNGEFVDSSGNGWWKDSSFTTVDISRQLKEGVNTFILERDFFQSDNVYHVLFDKGGYETEKNKLTFDVELENIYLTGSFGVYSDSEFTPGGNGSYFTEGPFYLDKLPAEADGKDLSKEGFLFFAGSVQLSSKVWIGNTEGREYLLKLPCPDASMLDVSVNGREAGSLLWAPWELEIGSFLKEGENEITLTLYGSNRNMLGPHHHIDGEPFNVGPGSFTGEWSWVEKKSEANPATAEERQKNYWDERYAFVPFGLGAYDD